MKKLASILIALTLILSMFTGFSVFAAKEGYVTFFDADGNMISEITTERTISAEIGFYPQGNTTANVIVAHYNHGGAMTGFYVADTISATASDEPVTANIEEIDVSDATDGAFKVFVWNSFDSISPVSNCSGEITRPEFKLELEDGVVLKNTELYVPGAYAQIPYGVVLSEGAETLSLSVTSVNDSQSGIVAGETDKLTSLDVHMEGVSKDNKTPIIITLYDVAAKGLNLGNLALYHVENGETVQMTQVSSLEEVTAHNSFYYDALEGTLTLALATFSEIAVVEDTEKAWEGGFDYSWYLNRTGDTYKIANADQLAAFGAIVGGMDGQTRDSFEGKTVTLAADINFGDYENANPEVNFTPIGYYFTLDNPETEAANDVYSTVYAFKGTFDGAGHTVANFYQNTWEIKGDYNSGYPAGSNYYKDGMGLFGYILGGTVENLTVKNFSSDGEFTPTGSVTAYASDSTFKNIALVNCNPRVYNTGNGGIVGIGGNSDDPEDYKLTFENITIDNSNKITALWGSYDVACGGLVGMFRGAGHVYMTNCHVGAQLDVFNDVCGNYQYYRYRYAGMLIGTNKNMVNEDGLIKPELTKVHAKDCTVHFGDWNNYWYCELVANSLASYTHDHQFSRLTRVDSVDVGAMTVTVDGVTTAIPTSGSYNYVTVFAPYCDENATCYHFVNGAVWNHEDAGYEDVDVNGDGVKEHVLKEDRQHYYLPFNQVITGYGWGVEHVPVDDENCDLAGVTILGREVADSVVKFEEVATAADSYTTGATVTVGELFNEVENSGVEIDVDNVQVTVSPVGTDSTASATYEANTTDWTQGALTFDGIGAATITITDYYYCTPTTITVNITERQSVEKFDLMFENTDSYLYRVGNDNTTPVKLSSLFKAKEGAEIGTVSVTVVAVGGTGASGTTSADSYTSTTWTNGTIDFNDTGVVKVTITDNNYCIPTELYLEVVDAKNITSAASSNGTDVVLLNDVKVAANGNANYSNCTVYGNGFTFDVSGGMNQYNSKQGHGIIIINGATLDHLRIIGDVYDEYGMYSKDLSNNLQNDYTGAVDATNSTIQNCYIANCAAPIRSNGNTIVDTTLYGGTVANLLISGGTNTLTNVTTINYNDDRGVIGMGIVITDGASTNTKLILNGYLKQHNYVYETDVSEIKVEDAKTVFESMFKDQFSAYHIGSNPRAVNTGIISINEGINFVDTVFTDNANTGYKVSNDVTVQVSGQGVATSVSAAIASVPGTGTVDNNYVDNGFVQGDYLPNFTFDLGNQIQPKDNDDDTHYLIGDKNGLNAMYVKGENTLTLDITKLASVSKYTNTSYPVTAKCITPAGEEQTGSVSLTTKGTYILVFTVEDNIFFDSDGNAINKTVTRTYEVPLVLDVYEKSIADATMTISSSSLTGEYVNSGTNKKYKMYPLKAITSIMDDANKDGVLETFNFKSNIQSAVLTPESNNAFSSPTTITVTYTGGQILTIVLGTPSGLNSPGASNGGKTISVYTDSTNGIYLQSDGAVASSSAVAGTWPLNSWSFKGTSGKVITDSTIVTINFTKPSSDTCLAEGTLITMADGSKRAVEDLRKGDSVMAFDHLTGEITKNDVIIVVRTESEHYENTFVFDDGSELATINEHGIYDLDLNKYVNIDHENFSEYVGHRFVSVDTNGTIGVKKLMDVESVYTSGYKYDIVTDKTLNYVAEDTLSVTHVLVDVINSFDFAEDMKYDASAMAEDIEKYGLYTYDEWDEYCDISVFEQYNIPVMKVGISKGLYTKEYIIGLINTYVLDDSVQIID